MAPKVHKGKNLLKAICNILNLSIIDFDLVVSQMMTSVSLVVNLSL